MKSLLDPIRFNQARMSSLSSPPMSELAMYFVGNAIRAGVAERRVSDEMLCISSGPHAMVEDIRHLVGGANALKTRDLDAGLDLGLKRQVSLSPTHPATPNQLSQGG